MRSRIVLILLVGLYVCSFFFRGEDPKVDLGDRVVEGVFFQGGYGMQWVYDAADEFERAHPEIESLGKPPRQGPDPPPVFGRQPDRRVLGHSQHQLLGKPRGDLLPHPSGADYQGITVETVKD